MNGIIIGCGYVGKAVALCWRQHGITVTATTTRSDRLPELELVADRALVLNGNAAAALRSVLADQQIVLLSVGAPNANAYEETYLQTAKTLVSVLPDVPVVQQIIYTGSYAVYGDCQGEWVTEATPVSPTNRNGEILAETEQVLLSAATNSRSVCVLRLGGIYGPGRELIKIFRRAAGTTRPGDGNDITNWVHLDDIVGAIDFARTHRLCGIYNLVQDVPTTTGHLLGQLFQVHQLPAVTWDASQPSHRPYNAKVSNQKLREAGYCFQHPSIDVNR
ncbi:SDR family oxidoreductase [Thermocoleostomius sinensis]|uniref:SDR family oxidoreductase n=1 Tax=Thermocoleostomius sinensis A174 TaxID=2016057 RepID=A0A9E9C9F8_9CYAN|nr:SDR family oxidoreductase [Thermocoleostomius sinensis]WAL61533.1 SDR family oxidoreductase [Thermocoleostomius sinensis A174]